MPEALKKSQHFPQEPSSYGLIPGVDSHFECAEFAVRHASHPRASERGDAGPVDQTSFSRVNSDHKLYIEKYRFCRVIVS